RALREKLQPCHGDGGRGRDAESDLLSLDRHHGHADVASDQHLFADPSCEHQHDATPSLKAGRPAHPLRPVNRVGRPRARHARRIFFARSARLWPYRPRRTYNGPASGPGGGPIMASPDPQSVTRLIRAAQQDRASAVGPLLSVYFDRLVQLARRRLQGLPGMASYDEDVALRSFHSVYQRLRDPARPLHLAGRDDLWRLLATPTTTPARRPFPP